MMSLPVWLTRPMYPGEGSLSRGSQSSVGGGGWTLLPAATKLGQGNVFTGACDSVHGGGGLRQG